MTQPRILDAIDLRILAALSRDGRITWGDLAEEVGLSTTPTLRRVRQMEDEGLIRGYAAQLDETRLLGEMSAFISISMERQVRENLDRFETSIARLPEVIRGYLMSGSNDYMIHVYVHDLDHYRGFMEKLTEIEGIAHINSSFVLNTFMNRAGPSLVDARREPEPSGPRPRRA